MKTRLLPALFAGAVLMFAAGCQTVQTRINQKPEAFARLDAATQAKIRQGIIERGYTEDLVWLALGKPAQRHEFTNSNGRHVSWIYHRRVAGDGGKGEIVSEWRGRPMNYYPPMDQPRLAGGSNTFISEPRAPLPAPNLSDQPERFSHDVPARINTYLLEVVFKDGKVVAAPASA